MSYEKNDTLPGLSATAAMAPTNLISPKVPYVPHISNFRPQNLHNLILSPSLPLACVAPAYQYIRRLQASGQRKKTVPLLFLEKLHKHVLRSNDMGPRYDSSAGKEAWCSLGTSFTLLARLDSRHPVPVLRLARVSPAGVARRGAMPSSEALRGALSVFAQARSRRTCRCISSSTTEP